MNKIPQKEAKVKFISLFPLNYQSHINNIFLEAIRKDGKDTAAKVALYAKARAIVGIQKARADNDIHSYDKFKLLSNMLTEHLETALEYAAYCLEWERLPKSTKAKIKAERAAYHRKVWYESQERGGA